MNRNEDYTEKRLLVCVNPIPKRDGTCCVNRGSKALIAALEQEIKTRSIDVKIEPVVCLGKCWQGPSMRLAPGGAFFLEVKPEDITSIVDELEKACGKRAVTSPSEIELYYPGG